MSICLLLIPEYCCHTLSLEIWQKLVAQEIVAIAVVLSKPLDSILFLLMSFHLCVSLRTMSKRSFERNIFVIFSFDLFTCHDSI